MVLDLALHVHVLHPSDSKISVVFIAVILNTSSIKYICGSQLETNLKSAVSIKFCDKNMPNIGKCALFCSVGRNDYFLVYIPCWVPIERAARVLSA